MQAFVGDGELVLEDFAVGPVTRLDAFFQLEGRIGSGEHGRRVGADDVQLALRQLGDFIAVADDAGVQGAVRTVGIAGVDGGENLAIGPRRIGFYHQHRYWAVAQQFPIVWG